MSPRGVEGPDDTIRLSWGAKEWVAVVVVAISAVVAIWKAIDTAREEGRLTRTELTTELRATRREFTLGLENLSSKLEAHVDGSMDRLVILEGNLRDVDERQRDVRERLRVVEQAVGIPTNGSSTATPPLKRSR